MGSEPPLQTASDFHAPPYSVAEWETGLPDTDSLPSLSQSLIPSELASAFRISPLPHRSDDDVIRASEEFVLSLTREGSESFPIGSGSGSGSDTKKSKRIDNFVEEVDSGVDNNGNIDADEGENIADKTVKRQRLVWTPQLHKRFVDVVAHLGIKNAVPKTIMQLMNVEGLTRENVASHLQKYRLYLKRMNGGLEGGSGSGELVWESNGSGDLGNGGSVGVPIPMMPYRGVTGQGMLPMTPPPAVYGVPNGHMTGNNNGFAGYGGFEYGRMQGAEWNGFRNGSIGSFNQVYPNENYVNMTDD